MTKSGRVFSGKPVVFSIPIDFCIEFWNSTFSPVLEWFWSSILREYFKPLGRELSNGANPGCCIAASVLKLFKIFCGQQNLDIL